MNQVMCWNGGVTEYNQKEESKTSIRGQQRHFLKVNTDKIKHVRTLRGGN